MFALQSPTRIDPMVQTTLWMRRFLPLLLLLLCLLCLLSLATGPYAYADDTNAQLSASENNGFVGTPVCAQCHSEQASAWSGSHHDLAMQKPTPNTVLGDFNNASFEHFGVRTQFSQRDGRYYVTTDGPDGNATEYEVAWVFGVDPLQQYLLPLPGGRLQALTVAWDSRPKAHGGQRWYHLYPDEAIPHGDPLHWTGPYQNWNTRCAECHSTDLQKNYNASTHEFSTTFFEEDVGCEGCHGPGQAHVKLAEADTLRGVENLGLQTALAARGQWAFAEGESIAKRLSPLSGQQQIDTCGRCHARRGTLGEYHYGKPLSDTHRLSLLGEPLYHGDGQILDEVYVYGSFVQSKMHQAGVVCSNCHEPHTTKLRAPGNGVCAQCHQPAVFDSPQHHHHSADSSGAQCVNCHMPSTIYMGVDARRDHSMRVPRPDLSVVTGSPNACNDCHLDQNADWSLTALDDWGVPRRNDSAHVLAMTALANGDTRGVPQLTQLAADPTQSSIWRATALERAASAGDVNALRLAESLLQSTDPLLRVSAVRSLQTLPMPQRFQRLSALANDSVTGVRLEVAMALASTPLDQLTEQDRSELLGLFDEYRSIQQRHADMPSIQMQLGLFNTARADLPAAEAAYREAIRLNPQLIGAHLNLADLLRSQQRESEARSQLQTALVVAPDSGDALHALGLLEARQGNRDAALAALGRAAALESSGSRHRFVYAIAQHDFGDASAAILTLRKLHARLPGDEQVLLALTNYSAEVGDRASAQRYAQKLTALSPENRAYAQLLRDVSR